MTLMDYRTWFKEYCPYVDWVHRYLLGMPVHEMDAVREFLTFTIYESTNLKEINNSSFTEINNITLDFLQTPEFKEDKRIDKLVSRLIDKWLWGLSNLKNEFRPANKETLVTGVSYYLYNHTYELCEEMATKFIRRTYCIFN